MRKILFVSEVNPSGKISFGGIAGGKKNYDALIRCFGEKNVYAAIISNEKSSNDSRIRLFDKHQSKLQYFINTLFLWNCYDRKTVRDIIRYIKDNDIKEVFLDGSIYGRLAKRLKKIDCYVYVYFHNVERDFAKMLVKNQGLIYLGQYLSYWYNERLSARYGDRLIALNERDQKLINKYYNVQCYEIVPVTYVDRFDENRCMVDKKENSKKLLFVGSAGLKANVDGIKWFICNVFKFLPKDYILQIVGKGFEKYKDELSIDKNIQVIGTVDDVDDYYYKADVVVAPILYGCGMKTKTAEAMMFGKCIMASSEALEGYEYEDIQAIQRCDTVEEYIKALKDVDVRRFELSVRMRFLEKYEENASRETYKRIFMTNMEEK